MSKVIAKELNEGRSPFGNKDRFKYWAMIALISKFKIPIPEDGEFNVQCSINGVEVNFVDLFDRLEDAFQEGLEDKEQAYVEKRFYDFEEKVRKALVAAEKTFEKKMKVKLQEKEWDDWEEWNED